MHKTDIISNDILKAQLVADCFAAVEAYKGAITEPEDIARMLSKIRTCVRVKTSRGVKTASLDINTDGFVFRKSVVLA